MMKGKGVNHHLWRRGVGLGTSGGGSQKRRNRRIGSKKEKKGWRMYPPHIKERNAITWMTYILTGKRRRKGKARIYCWDYQKRGGKGLAT